MRFFFIFSVLLVFASGAGTAWANCQSPAGAAGTMNYFGAPDHVFKYCNGSKWVPMVAPICAAGKSLVMGENEWGCCPMLAETWQEPLSMPAGNLPVLYGVAYGGGAFVAVGYNFPLSLRSVDGLNWTSHAIPEQGQWEGVAYSNGKFVAVRRQQTGGVMVSNDGGQTWGLGDAAADAQWVSIAYGKGLFVAIARQKNSPSVMTSPDGLIWTMRATPSFRNWNHVAYLDMGGGTGMFVATAHNDTGVNVMTSEDGITWVGDSVLEQAWRGVTYGKGLIVLVGTSNANGQYGVATKAPGDPSWTPRTTPLGVWSDVVYANDLFVAVGNGTSQVMTSKDGINWQAEPSIGLNLGVLAYGDGMFVAAGSSAAKLMVSPIKHCP